MVSQLLSRQYHAGHQTCQKYVKKCQKFCLVFTVARVAQ